jgi:hypothetical protein
MVLNILDVAIGLRSRNMGLGVFDSKHTAVSQETLFYVGLVLKVVYTVLSRVDKEALAFVELGHQMGTSAGRTRSSADNIEVLRRRKISSSLVVNRTQEFKIGNGADYGTNKSWRGGQRYLIGTSFNVASPGVRVGAGADNPTNMRFFRYRFQMGHSPGSIEKSMIYESSSRENSKPTGSSFRERERESNSSRDCWYLYWQDNLVSNRSTSTSRI